METRQIRNLFLQYFEKNGHKVVQSSPLVPHNDPTLMFTNAGMVQFKNYFTGAEKPDFTRAATSQKCVRAGGKHNDLENVGYTARHHTFFEMLGNFSFGDYFKDEAIPLAWNLLTKEYGINKDKLYITVYHDDVEAINIWKKITGFSDSKILKIETSDNFWSMGDTGPCGPCSEIFYDHGDKYPGGLPGTPDGDGDRYIEIWNLVFMQFEDLPGGKRIALPKPSIDTGMGLERISAVLQGKHDNFDIDLFQNLIDSSKHLSGNASNSNSHRVIADHIRSMSFLIADGVMPSNEGRGYVLRRIMRRAMRHVHNLGCKDAILHKIVPTLVSEMGDSYPELRRAQAVISSIVELEENKFRETLDKGLKILEEETKSLNSGDTLDGKVAFKLYDTYGFPLDLTSDIMRNKDMSVDLDTFNSEMDEQKRRAKAAWAGSGEKATDEIWLKLADELPATEFLGYVLNEADSQVVAIIQDGKPVKSASSGQAVVILNQTPFYAESGGQVGDTGYIGENQVLDSKKYASKLYGHTVEILHNISVGDTVKASIDNDRRNKIRANHSATHLLHKALRATLGEHVSQKGSIVTSDKLRFDFSHIKAMSPEEIATVEKMVNTMIIQNSGANTKLMSTDAAIEAGAMALFGEKYGEEVRVVSMADSIELCGGTHVSATGDIGMFKITSEEAIASGVRRLEAITGIAALEYMNAKEQSLRTIASQFKCSEADLPKKISALSDEKKSLEKRLSNLKVKIAIESEATQEIPGVYYYKSLEDVDSAEARTVLDDMKKKYPDSKVLVVSSVSNGKASMIIQSNSADINANDLAKIAAEKLGGNGGGRTDQAQAGGERVSEIKAAIQSISGSINSISKTAMSA